MIMTKVNRTHENIYKIVYNVHNLGVFPTLTSIIV